MIIAVLAAVVAVPDRARAAVAVGMLALAALHSWEHPERLAWWWGLLLPVDLVQGVPTGILDLARYGGLAWLVWSFAPDLSGPRRPVIVRIAVLVAVVGVMRGAPSVVRADRSGMLVGAVMVMAAATAPFVAWRVRAHYHVLAGFMGGVLFSCIVCFMQALDLPTLQPGNQSGQRFPGLASTTMLFTWHLAVALLVAIYFLADRRHPRIYRATAVALTPAVLAALAVNGAQGGLLGLGLATLVTGLWGWRSVNWSRVAPYLLAATGLLVVVGVVLVVSGVRTPTIDGLRGKGDYTNEKARWEYDRAGVEVMVDHPLVGIGRANFKEAHNDQPPHFLPLDAGVTGGIIPFLTALYLLWCVFKVLLQGPVGRRPAAWLGLAVTSTLFGYTLIDANGPFTGLPRLTLLLIAVAAAQGEPWPTPEELDVEVPRPEVANT